MTACYGPTCAAHHPRCQCERPGFDYESPYGPAGFFCSLCGRWRDTPEEMPSMQSVQRGADWRPLTMAIAVSWIALLVFAGIIWFISGVQL